MSKKMRPSLKDYLRTGEVRLEIVEAEPQSTPVNAKPIDKTAKKQSVKPRAPRKTEAQTKSKNPVKTQDPKKTTKAERTRKAAEAVPSYPGLEFLDLLCEADRHIWEPILQAGTEIHFLPLDLIAMREDFRTMDRNRFTCYLLDKKGDALRPARTSVQIKEPLRLMIKWDEMGILTLYGLETGSRSKPKTAP